MKIVVAIVTYERPELLLRCLDSIQLLNESFNIEVRVVINGNDARSLDVVKNHAIKIQIIPLHEKKTPAHCRNLALQDDNWDYAFFLDDDAYISSKYVSLLKRIFEKRPPPMIFGGPDRSPPRASLFEYLVGLTQQSILATSITRYRHLDIEVLDEEMGTTSNESKLILCNLWVSQKIWEKVGQFDTRFFRNEENVWLDRANRITDSIYYFGNLSVFHSKKDNWIDLCYAVFRSGYFRIQSAIYAQSKLPLIYLVPFVFVLYLLGLLTGLWGQSFIVHLPLFLYFVLIFIASLYLGIRNQCLKYFPIIAFIHISMNISYGLGSIWGIFGKPEELDS